MLQLPMRILMAFPRNFFFGGGGTTTPRTKQMLRGPELVMGDSMKLMRVFEDVRGLGMLSLYGRFAQMRG